MRAIFRVILPIPEIGAMPGDLLHAEPSSADYPLSLTRHLDRSILPIVLDPDRLTQIQLFCDEPGQTQLRLDFPVEPAPLPPRRRVWYGRLPAKRSAHRHLRLVS